MHGVARTATDDVEVHAWHTANFHQLTMSTVGAESAVGNLESERIENGLVDDDGHVDPARLGTARSKFSCIGMASSRLTYR